MAKSKEQFKARNLRKNGFSIREIAKKLKVSRGSASLWCRDIQLTDKQVKKLHEQMVKGSYAGRLKGTLVQKERKQEKINYYLKKGKEDIINIKKRELFIAGLALYWAEGSNKNPGVRFHNSDPLIIKFIMKWFRDILKIPDERFLMYININRIHKVRLEEVIKFWSDIACISVKQFRKPYLIKVKNKKVYENFSKHYGTLCVRVSRSTELFYQIKGWIKALGETRAV